MSRASGSYSEQLKSLNDTIEFISCERELFLNKKFKDEKAGLSRASGSYSIGAVVFTVDDSLSRTSGSYSVGQGYIQIYGDVCPVRAGVILVN